MILYSLFLLRDNKLLHHKNPDFKTSWQPLYITNIEIFASGKLFLRFFIIGIDNKVFPIPGIEYTNIFMNITLGKKYYKAFLF